MRIRSIKPEFWRSEDVKALSRDVRLLFIGLWSYVDDNGVGIDDYRQIAADLFPLEDDPQEVREYVRDGLATLSRRSRELSRMPLLVRYEVNGRRYLSITGWAHQRVDKPNKPRYPVPTDDVLTRENPDETTEFSTPSREVRENVVPGTGEQGNRGRGEVKTSASDDAGMFDDLAPVAPRYDREFDEFWSHYPLKKGKEPGRRAFIKARKDGMPLEKLISAVDQFALEVRGIDPKKIKYAQGWLNDKRWQDYDEPGAPRLHVVADGNWRGARREGPYRDREDEDYYGEIS